MADVAELGVKLTADGSEQVISALNRVESAVAGTHQSTVAMGAAIGVASSVASAAFGAIANAAQGALGAVGGATIGLNASLEQATIGFTTLLKSGEAAQGFLKDLQQFAQTTPFEFKDLVPMAQRFMAMGFAAKDVIPILTDVGNVAAAMGSGREGIDRITLAIGQMHSATVVHAQDMNQLIQAGVPAWELLSQATGKSTAEVRKLSEAGKISADVFIAAFRAWSQNNVGDMMAAQSRTFIGALSNIKDALGIAVAAGFKPLFDTVRDLAVTFADFVQSETFGVWATDLKITLGQLTPTISALAGWLMGQLPAAMSAAEAGAHAFVAAVQDLGPKLADLAEKAGPVLAAAWERLSAVLAPVGAAFATIAPLLATAYGAVQQLADAVNDRLGAALSGLGEQLGRAGDTVGPIVAALWNLGEAARSVELDALSAAAGAVGDALNALGTVASTAFQSLQIAAVDATNAIIPALQGLGEWLGSEIPPKIAALQASWDGFWATAGPLIQAFWGAAQPVLEGIGSIIATVVIVELQAMKAVWDQVWGGIKAVMDAIAPMIGQFSEALGNAMKGAAEGITAGLNSAKPAVAEAATEVGTTIKNNIVQGAAPVGAAVAAAVEPAAAAVAKVGTSASAAAPAVTSLGTAGTTAASGMGTATAAAKDLDGVMAQLAKATTPDAVQQALLWQNANSALTEALKGLNVETQASILAQKNAGDVYGAVNRAFEAQGLTADDATAAVHGLATAHDQLAAAAQRTAAALAAERSMAAGEAEGLARPAAGVQGLVSTAGFAGLGAFPPATLQATGQQAGAALSQGVQAGVAAATPGIQSAVRAALNPGRPTGGSPDIQNLGSSATGNGGNSSSPFADPEFAAWYKSYHADLEKALNAGMDAVLDLDVLLAEFAAVQRQHAADVNHAQLEWITSVEKAAAGVDRAGEKLAAALQTPAQQQASFEGVPSYQSTYDTLAQQQATTQLNALTAGMDLAARASVEFTAATQGPVAALAQLGVAVDTAADATQSAAGKAASATMEAFQTHQNVIAQWAGQVQATGSGMDFVAASAARAGYALVLAGDDGLLAAAAASAAAEEWKLAIATAQALMAGAIRNAGVAGGVTEKGLTYTQIMNGTQGTGGGIGGSNQGSSNLPPGNYYGIPVVSPITGGTLRGFADGGWVTEPVVGRGVRSGAPYAFGENGPEYVSPGGGGDVHVTINVQAGMGAGDVIQDSPFWNRVVDGPFSQALKRRFPTVGR